MFGSDVKQYNSVVRVWLSRNNRIALVIIVGYHLSPRYQLLHYRSKPTFQLSVTPPWILVCGRVRLRHRKLKVG